MNQILNVVKNIFSKEHSGQVLGIDIGSSSIKIILLEKVAEKAVLRNYGEIALGPRVGISVGQATNLPTEKLADALREILKETTIIPHHTLIAIPFNASLLSIIELPTREKKDLVAMIPLEARRYIPVPITDVSLDWWILPPRKSEQKPEGILHSYHTPKILTDTIPFMSDQKTTGKTEVIIAAIHNEIIKKYEVIKNLVHIPTQSSHFEIEIFSTLRSVVGNDHSAIIVIDIGAGATKLILIDEGVVRGSHIISIGGQDITLAISRSKGITFEEAEEKKCRIGLTGDEESRDILASAEILIENIMSEAARFIENYEKKYGAKIIKIILVGGGSRLGGLKEKVATQFPSVLIIQGDPFSRINTPVFLTQTIKELSPNFAVAIGIALKGLEE